MSIFTVILLVTLFLVLIYLEMHIKLRRYELAVRGVIKLDYVSDLVCNEGAKLGLSG
jgi:hypothetical protein